MSNSSFRERRTLLANAGNESTTSRALLRKSLLELILKRPWQRIRVQEVCARARVARSTFYAHFAHKEELLLSGFDDLKQELMATRGKRGAQGALMFLPGLIAHAAENSRMFRRLVGSGAGALPAAHFRMFVLELVQEDLVGRAHPTVAEVLKTRYIAGAICDVLMWWLQDEPDASPDEICRHCRRLTQRLVENS